jgi:hypothetical protein
MDRAARGRRRGWAKPAAKGLTGALRPSEAVGHADATHDQPVAPIGSLGDLRDPIGLGGDRDPGRLGNGGDGGADRLGLADRDRGAHPVAAQPL